MHNIENHIDLMIDFLSKKQNPTILEFGVERGSSTKKFISLAEKNSGKVFSVDISDCSKVSNSKVYDLTLDSVKEFYYNNTENCSLKFFFNHKENGLAMIYKKKKFGTEPNKIKKIWNYNIIFKIIYPLLKKTSNLCKSIFKKKV